MASLVKDYTLSISDVRAYKKGVAGGNFQLKTIGHQTYNYNPSTGELTATGIGTGSGSAGVAASIAAASAANRLAFDQQKFDAEFGLNKEKFGFTKEQYGDTLARQARTDAEAAANNRAQQATANRNSDWSIVQAAQQGRISIADAMTKLADLRHQEQSDPFKFGQYLQHLAALPQGSGNPVQSLIGSGVKIAPDTSGYDSIQGILQKVLDEYNQIPSFGAAEQSRGALEGPDAGAARTFLSQRPEDLQRMFGGGGGDKPYGFNSSQDATDFAGQIKGASPEQLSALQQIAASQAGTPQAHAHGGGMTTTGPAILVDVKTGKPLGLMGEAGPERLTITPLQHMAVHAMDPALGASAAQHTHPNVESTPEGALQHMAAGTEPHFAGGGTVDVGGAPAANPGNAPPPGNTDPNWGDAGTYNPTTGRVEFPNTGPDRDRPSQLGDIATVHDALHTTPPATAAAAPGDQITGIKPTGALAQTAAGISAVQPSAAQTVARTAQTQAAAPAAQPANMAQTASAPQTAATAPEAPPWTPPANAISVRWTHDQYMWMAVASGVPREQAEHNYAVDKYLVEGARQDAGRRPPRKPAPPPAPADNTIQPANAQAIALGKALRPLNIATPEMLDYLDRGLAPPPGTVTDAFMAKLPPSLRLLLQGVIKAFGDRTDDYEASRQQFRVPGAELQVASR